MDEARAILDQLMGKTRNFTDSQKVTLQQIHFYDDQVCKCYICGLCPYKAFNATKSDMGKCPYPVCGDIDADMCREEWNKLPQEEKDKYGYERKTLLILENIVKQCDRKIERQKQRAEQDTEMTDDDLKRIVVIYKQIADVTEQCEHAADKGDIDEAMVLAKQIDQLKEAARRIVNPPEEKKIAVCEVSGNFMSSKDNDERMRAHFEGKQFIGWKMVRDKYAQLLASNPPEASGAPPHLSRGGGSGSGVGSGGGDRRGGVQDNRDRRGRDGGRYDSRGGGRRGEEHDRPRDWDEKRGAGGKGRSRSRSRSVGRRGEYRGRDRGEGYGNGRRSRSGSRNRTVHNSSNAPHTSEGPPQNAPPMSGVYVDAGVRGRRKDAEDGLSTGAKPESRGRSKSSGDDSEPKFFLGGKDEYRRSSSRSHSKRRHKDKKHKKSKKEKKNKKNDRRRSKSHDSSSSSSVDEKDDAAPSKRARSGSPGRTNTIAVANASAGSGGVVQLTKGWQIVTASSENTQESSTPSIPVIALPRASPYASSKSNMPFRVVDDDIEEGEEVE